MELSRSSSSSTLLNSPKLHPRNPRFINPNKAFNREKRSTSLNFSSELRKYGDVLGRFSRRESSIVIRASSGEAEVGTAVVEKPKLGRFQVSEGFPTPFGATARDDGVNFAIFSANAVSATLCLMSPADLQEVSR